MASVTIAEITLKVGDREIELTEQEARELRGALNDLFGAAYQPSVPLTQPVILGPMTIGDPPWSISPGLMGSTPPNPPKPYCAAAYNDPTLSWY